MISGAKKGASKQHRPHIAKDSAASTNFFHGLYGLSEGEILGLVDGGKSIKLDGTPLINDNGQPNFPNIQWDFRSGTTHQEHIAGFGSVNNERSLNVEIRHDRAFTQHITNTKLDAAVIRLSWNALRETRDNGDVVGYRIDYAVDVQTNSGTWREVQTYTINDKTSSGYQRSHRIDLPKAKRGWTVRVRRITPNRDSDLISDTMSIVAITEVIDAKLRYPCTALLSLKYDAETFSNVAKIAVRVKGLIIRVPNNYDPERRTYTGIWDGTFKMAYTNNPAWIFYDLCTAKRYGLGHRLADKVDKWALYSLAQYCDELVDDGQGGKEPRFTCNVYLQKAEDAYKVLQNIASVFRAMSYWNGTQIIVDADVPKDPVYTFSTSNVVNGEFVYTGTRARDRHTIAKVAYDDPDNDFKTEYVMVRDDYAIAKYGISIVEINAFGCTSRGQAERAGVWALNSEQLETQTVSFKTGLQGFIPSVGQVINIADNVRAGRAITGKIQAINNRQITLDRTAGKVSDTFTDENGNTAKITNVKGNIITLDKTPTAKTGEIWAIKADDLHLAQFRIISISHNDDDTFGITALQYEPTKYRLTDTGVRLTPKPISVIKPTVLSAPQSVEINQSNRVLQGQSVTTMTVNWSQVVGAVAYIVEWRKDDNAWISQKVASQSLDIDGVYQGVYQARVRAIDAFDNESLATSSTQTRITGKQGRPPRLTGLSVKGVLFGMELGWLFGVKSEDTNYTEIQVSPDGRSNIATLGTFAYPTNKHEITGLQGNLTQYYRARIVDKLGNTSDWTNWVSGTTSADADKVLSLIGGHISQSHLDQALRTPIGKIGGLESGLNGIKGQIPTLQSAISNINGQLPTLNTEIANTKRNLQTAQSTLNTAVANITTERNRITSAIRDITALQSANTTKTQEIANLTQTVGSHTSSIRELGVTTGDLSQKYTQIKTVADKATSDITAIKQTQAGQAVEQSSLKARFDNLAMGGRNLLKSSSPNVSNANYMHRFELVASPRVGDEVVVTLWGDMGADRTGIGVYNTQGYTELFKLAKIADGVYQGKGLWKLPMNGNTPRTPNDTHLNVYFYPNSATSQNRIDKIKLEKGNVATDWTPAIQNRYGRA